MTRADAGRGAGRGGRGVGEGTLGMGAPSRRGPRLPILAVVAAAVMAALAGCGAGQPTSITTGVSPQAVAECMRAHGLPDFPAPDGAGRLAIVVTRSQVRVNGLTLREDPQRFGAAGQACLNPVAPSEAANAAPSPQLQQRADAFAACVRAHGVPRFPNPRLTGTGLHMQVPLGANPKAVQAAVRACQSLLPAPSATPEGGAASPGQG